MSRALRILVAAAVFFGGIVSLLAAENRATGTRHGDHRSRSPARARPARCAHDLAPVVAGAERELSADDRSDVFVVVAAQGDSSRDRGGDRSLRRPAEGGISDRDHRRRRGLRRTIVRSRQSEIPRHPFRAGRHRQPHGPGLCLGRLLRRDQADLSSCAFRDQTGWRQDSHAAADDAQSGDEGARRAPDGRERQSRSPAPRSRDAGSAMATGRG
ncbi:hypothetical protein ACVWZV_003088 [Bradyrhizobium sp. GM5.1]